MMGAKSGSMQTNAGHNVALASWVRMLNELVRVVMHSARNVGIRDSPDWPYAISAAVYPLMTSSIKGAVERLKASACTTSSSVSEGLCLCPTADRGTCQGCVASSCMYISAVALSCQCRSQIIEPCMMHDA